MGDYKKRKEYARAILSRRYIPLEDKVFFVVAIIIFISVFALLKLFYDDLSPSLLIYDNNFFRSLIITSVISLFIRVALYKLIFVKLDCIIKVIYTRKVFAVTGGTARDASGEELDGRLHVVHGFAKKIKVLLLNSLKIIGRKNRQNYEQKAEVNPLKLINDITIVRRPFPPQLPLEVFSNDELGQLALALEEEHLNQLKQDNTIVDLLEAFPVPSAVISRDGKFVYVNKLFSEIKTIQLRNCVNTKVIDCNIENILEHEFLFSRDLIANVISVMEQNSPKIIDKSFILNTENGAKAYNISVSSITKNTKRMAIIALKEQPFLRDDYVKNIIYDIIAHQMDLIDDIIHVVKNDKEAVNYLDKCELLKDQINTLLDFIRMNENKISHEKIEYNIHSLCQNLQNSLLYKQKIHFFVDFSIPNRIIGIPAYLKQFLKFLIHDYFTLNTDNLNVNILRDIQSGEIVVSLVAAQTPKRISNKNNYLLAQFARKYNMSIKPIQSNNDTRFFVFTFAIEQSNSYKSLIPIDSISQLLEREVLIVYDVEADKSELFDVINSIGCKSITYLALEDVREQELFNNNFNSAIIYTSVASWENSKRIKNAVAFLQEKKIPALFVTPFPKRGDSVEVQKIGFSGYLGKPFSTQDIQNILQILSNPHSLEMCLKRGVITRHVVQDLAREAGTALVAEFDSESSNGADAMIETLHRLAIQVLRSKTRSDFFEKLYQQSYSYVFYPSHISSGLRRQLNMAMRGKTAICYATDSVDVDNIGDILLQCQFAFIANPADITATINAITKAHYEKRSFDDINNDEDIMDVS